MIHAWSPQVRMVVSDVGGARRVGEVVLLDELSGLCAATDDQQAGDLPDLREDVLPELVGQRDEDVGHVVLPSGRRGQPAPDR